MPLGASVPSEKLCAWLANAGEQLWDDLSAKFNLKSLLAGHTVSSPGLWSIDKLATLNGLAGRRVQSRGLACEVLKGMGAEPIHRTGNDQDYAALTHGTLGAIDLDCLTNGIAGGLSQIAKFCMLGGLTTDGSAVSVTFNRDIWLSLGPKLQNVVRSVAANEFARSTAAATANRQIIQRALAEVHGVTFYSAPSDLANTAARVAEAVVADVAARDQISMRINAEYMKVRQNSPNGSLS
jgi:TRAP-type mannitol/chloroaromatic compound transport system substrate-binding protein